MRRQKARTNLGLTASGRRGQALVEVTLLLPWLVFAFIATFDFGIFAYALISTQNAARSVAMYAAQSTAVAKNPTSACFYALEELRDAPGVGAAMSTCVSPVTYSVVLRTPGAGNLTTVRVSVTYQTMQVIPLPGLMAGALTITRTVEMPVRGS